MRPAELDALVADDGEGEASEPLRMVVLNLMERNRQLEHALRSRVLIEQAKGILAERFSVSPDEAFELLRRGARNHRIRVHDLAGRVVAERHTPGEVARP